MKASQVLTGDASVRVMNIPHRPTADQWYGTFAAYGNGGSNFGGGTVVFSWSPNGGTTKIPLKDENGTAMSTAADAIFNRPLGTPHNNPDAISIWATLTGSVTPNVTVAVYDNR